MLSSSFGAIRFVVASSVFVWLGFAAADDAEPSGALIKSDQPKDRKKHQQPTTNLTLDEVLRSWVQKAALIERLDADFSRTTYDSTFSVMKLGKGKLATDSKGRGFFIQSGVKEIHAQQTVMRGTVRYDVKPSSTERWHWTGTATFKVDDESRRYETVEKPAELQFDADRPRPPELPESNMHILKASPDNFYWSWFIACDVMREPFFSRPFLMGMPVDEMQKRFKISLVKRSEFEIRLKFIPLVASSQSMYSQAELILAPKTYEPRAFRIVTPTGESEDIYVLRNVRINGISDEPYRDLDHLDLKGYRRRVSSVND